MMQGGEFFVKTDRYAIATRNCRSSQGLWWGRSGNSMGLILEARSPFFSIPESVFASRSLLLI